MHMAQHSPLTRTRLDGPTTLWAVLLVAALTWDASGLDLAVMRLIGTPTGFPGQHSFWLETVLHNGGRWVSQLAFVALALWALWPRRKAPSPLSPSRRERLLVPALVAVSAATVAVLKQFSHSSCPWEWEAFGGNAHYVSHWNLWVRDGGTGRCFPGGHASSALAFLALALPWLHAPGHERPRRTGWRWVAVVLVAGLVSGATQTLRGAHPPSHTLWTAVICASVALAGWRLAMPWLRAGNSA